MDKSISNDIEEGNIAALYEASHEGCESTLNSLIQRDALILNKISLTSFTDTPLHIAVLHGHLQFTSALLKNKPNLADRKDLGGRTALHLASAEGHSEIVTELLKTDSNVCLARDQDGRIPLHLAVMRGHIEVIEKLRNSKPNSILEDLDGASVLHLCVRYNCLDALKLLVEYSADDDANFLNFKDTDGNSILHLAVMLGQTETIKYLISISKIEGEANTINRIGNTALDVLELGQRDSKSRKIQDMLMAAGVRRSKDLNSAHDLLPKTQREPARYINIEGQSAPATQSRFKKWWAYCCLCRWIKHFRSQPSNWVVETRGTLMLVATVIATVTFQTGISPPGGVWQQGCKDTQYAGYQNCTGKSIFSDINPDDYEFLVSLNTTSLVAALSVVVLVTVGIAKRSKLFICILTLAMLIAVTFMLLTYLWAGHLLTSDEFKNRPTIFQIDFRSLQIWSVVLVIAAVVLIFRLLVWMVKALLKCKQCLTMSPTN